MSNFKGKEDRITAERNLKAQKRVKLKFMVFCNGQCAFIFVLSTCIFSKAHCSQVFGALAPLVSRLKKPGED